MSGRVLNGTDLGFRNFNPYIGSGPIPAEPLPHPGASCGLVCFPTLLGQDLFPGCGAEPLACHLGFVVPRPVIPSGLDHPTISDGAAGGAGNTRHRQASEPIAELPARVRRRCGVRRQTNVEQTEEPDGSASEPPGGDVGSDRAWQSVAAIRSAASLAADRRKIICARRTAIARLPESDPPPAAL